MRIDPVAANAIDSEALIAEPGASKPEKAGSASGAHDTRQELPEVISQHGVSTHEVAVSFDENRAIYRILDKKTGELIEQVPPDELLRVMRNIAQLVEQARAKVSVST